MAYTSVEIEAPAIDVYRALLDPTTYPEWLIGAKEIRAVDDTWPAPGSRFHHRVGLGPLSIADSTKLLDAEPPRLVRLAVRARPLISAVVTFRIVSDGMRSALSCEEEPALPLIGNVVRPVMDPLTHLRNQRSLRRLADLVARGSSGPDDGGRAVRRVGRPRSPSARPYDAPRRSAVPPRG